MNRDLRIVYMGTPDFAVTPLRMLVESGYNVVAVVTTPDKPSGRGLALSESPVKKYAVGAGLKVLQPEKLKDPAFVEEFRALNADLGIVIAFRMLPEIIWSMPRLGTFNLHASLLPDYRGAAPINWSIINGESVTGVTTFMLNHEIDKGDIIGRAEVPISPEDDAGSLHDKLMFAGTSLVAETVDKIASGKADPIPQSEIPAHSLKTAPKIFRETCRIDWSRSCAELHNFIRGLSPYPAAWSEMVKGDGGRIVVKIYSSSVEQAGQVKQFMQAGQAGQAEPVKPVELSGRSFEPGTILSDGKNYIKVACGDGFIHLLSLQIAGKKQMSAGELLRGFKDIREYKFG